MQDTVKAVQMKNSPMLNTLYTQAEEMLRKTKPWNRRDVFDYSYWLEGKKVSLKEILKHRLSLYDLDTLVISREQLCYDEIALAMREYFKNYNTTFSIKLKIKTVFGDWLKRLQEEYGLEKRDIPNELKIKSYELDIGISLVKALHAKDEKSALTKAQLSEKTGLDERTVQRYLRKLDPKLYDHTKSTNGMGPEYDPFRICGQPLVAEIKEVSDAYGRKRFLTPNTVHPIVLQENLLEVEILLKSLCLCYYKNNVNITLMIATDIWSQLSDYAKDKIEHDFELEDEELKDFINLLKSDETDDHICFYQTQRQVIEHHDVTNTDILWHAIKTGNEGYTLKYIDPSGHVFRLENIKIVRKDRCTFSAIDQDNNKYDFDESWVYEIKGGTVN